MSMSFDNLENNETITLINNKLLCYNLINKFYGKYLPNDRVKLINNTNNKIINAKMNELLNEISTALEDLENEIVNNLDYYEEKIRTDKIKEEKTQKAITNATFYTMYLLFKENPESFLNSKTEIDKIKEWENAEFSKVNKTV